MRERVRQTIASVWNLPADEIRDVLRRTIGMPLPRAPLEDDVLPLDVVERLQPLPECPASLRLTVIEEPDARDMRHRLCRSSERRHEDRADQGDEKPDEAARHGSLLRSQTCAGILHAMCRGRKPNFAE